MRGESAGVLPTGTVTFLFTDIEGSTPLWDAHPGAMREALTRHDEIIRKAIDAAGGHIFSTGGDGFGAVFARAGNAVAGAIGAQRSLGAEPWPKHVAIRVRMGVHSGEVEERDGDYFGLPVNRAARLMGAAHGGQVVMSALTAELLDDSVGVQLIDLGSVQLKGVVEPVHVFGASADGVDWIDRPLVSAQTSAGNLPRPRTELVGDLADLQRRVAALGRTRVVTLTGSGGVGKTRAAVEIGWLVLDEFPGGVWMLDLAPIADPDAVDAAAASMLSVQPQPGLSVVDSVVGWCLGRRMLLIVDNCEHVLEPVIELVSAIVEACPTVTIIATSREPLGIDGEQVIRIPSLEQNYGVELFCNRAVAADSSFTPSVDDLATIGTICERLDGIPLAIELAAARSPSLTPSELSQRLDDRFRLLRGGGRGGLERHQTLRATVTWSYQLLDSRHQLLFDRLSVFAGGFTLDAAEAVCTSDGIHVDDVVDLIGELVGKSMLIAERTGSSTRYRLLETLRQFGEDRLDERGETAGIRDCHLAHYRKVALGIDELWWTPAQLEMDDICDQEWDNFRAAHQWAITTGAFQDAVDIIEGVQAHIAMRVRIEVADWAAQTADLGERQHLNDGFLLAGRAYFAWLSGDPDHAAELAEQGLAISGDEKTIAMNQMMRMIGLGTAGRFEEAAALGAEVSACLAHTRELSNRFMLMSALTSFVSDETADVGTVVAEYVEIAHKMGAPYAIAAAQLTQADLLPSNEPVDADAAIDAYRNALALAIAARANQIELWARNGLAFALVEANRDDASPALRELVTRSVDARYGPTIVDGLDSCAVYLSRNGNRKHAATLLGFLELKPPLSDVTIECRKGVRDAVADLADLDSLLAAGAAMTLDEIAAFALDQLGPG